MTWESITTLLGEGLVKTTFGSPELAGLFLLGIIAYMLIRFNVSFDGIAIIMGISILSLSVIGIYQPEFLLLPLVMGMLLIIGLAIIKIFRR